METLGDRLRKARKSLGLSIEDVHHATKIRIAYLIAMEEGRFSELPGEVYARGFLKSVANVVGIDGDELVFEYDRIHEDSQIEQAEVDHRGISEIRERRKTVRAVPFAVIGLLLVAFLITALLLGKPKDRFEVDTIDTLALQNDSSDIQEILHENSEQHETREVATKDSQDGYDMKQIVEFEHSHELMAVITERCWVRVISDGHKVFERTMLPGETEIWKAKEEIRIKLGNAGGIDLTYNGVHMGPPGKSGDVIELLLPVSGP
jgi:cytoskeletal protein RodZ